ncbi:hypothetical protein [Mycobacterium sp.]|uniref:hypothetical protein n=1 Tax=Mycobacterium sp. TaxID=1785 RepID=UPI003F972420
MITIDVDNISMDDSDIADIRRQTKTYGRAKIKIYVTSPRGATYTLKGYAAYNLDDESIKIDFGSLTPNTKSAH